MLWPLDVSVSLQCGLLFTTVMLCCRLMLMALYNVSISLKGLKYLSENQGILPLIWSLLDGKLLHAPTTSVCPSLTDTVQTLCSSSGLQPVSSLTFNDTDIVNWINCQCHRLCIPGSNLCVCRRTLGGVSPLPASPAVHVVRGRCVAPVGLLAPGSRPVCSRQQARCQHAAKPETDCSADLGGPPGPPTGTTVWWTLLPCSCSHCVYHTNSVRTEMRTWYVFRLTSPVLLLLLASESFPATFLHTW